jgi:hypothetical protein
MSEMGLGCVKTWRREDPIEGDSFGLPLRDESSQVASIFDRLEEDHSSRSRASRVFAQPGSNASVGHGP